MSKNPSVTSASLAESNRKRQLGFGFAQHRELSVELFAGGGGFSAGARLAGLTMDIGINHNPVALAIHQANFPDCTQMINDVFEYNPAEVLISQGVNPAIFDEVKKWRQHRKANRSFHAVYHLHGSPDCTWHSGAKGGPLERHTVCGDHCDVDHTQLDQSVSERIRGLAWVLIGWAQIARPRRLTCENVPEFRNWGPTYMNEKGEVYADKTRNGETFEAFIGVLSTGIARYVPIPLPTLKYLVNPHDIPMRKRKVYSKQHWTGMRAWLKSAAGSIGGKGLSLRPWHGWMRENPSLPEMRRFLKPYLGDLYDEQELIDGLGYDVQYDTAIVHSDYGSPTSRKRFYLVARSDIVVPIKWPEKTHGDPKSDVVKSGERLPWRTAGECIDWSLVAPSIFDSKEEIMRSLGIKVKRPIVESSLRRISRGAVKYAIDTDEPYIVKVNHSYDQFRGQSVREPLQTITGTNGFALAMPYLQTYYGDTGRPGEVRGSSLYAPFATITSGGQRFGLCVPYITAIDNKSSGAYPVWGADRPLTTIVKENRHALTAAYVLPSKGTDPKRMPLGNSPRDPMTTITKSDTHGVLLAHLQIHYGRSVGQDAGAPIHALASRNKTSIIAAHCIKMKGDNLGYACSGPTQTITSGGLSHGVVETSLAEPFYRVGYDALDDDQKYKAWQIARLLEVYADVPEPMIGGIPLPRRSYAQTKEGFIIYDLGMRMLNERELFTAQGFSKEYIFNPEILVRDARGRVTKRRVNKKEAVAAVGNSVPPHFITALVTALNEAEIAVFGCLANEYDLMSA